MNFTEFNFTEIRPNSPDCDSKNIQLLFFQQGATAKIFAIITAKNGIYIEEFLPACIIGLDKDFPSKLLRN